MAQTEREARHAADAGERGGSSHTSQVEWVGARWELSSVIDLSAASLPLPPCFPHLHVHRGSPCPGIRRPGLPPREASVCAGGVQAAGGQGD